MKSRRDAVEETWFQTDKQTLDEVALDPDKFQSQVSWDFGQPHRTMVVFRNSKRSYLFAIVVAILFVFALTWVIRFILYPK